MKVRSITYGSQNPYGQGAEERLEITLNLDPEDNLESSLAYAKQFVLTNLNSLDQYNELGLQIESKRQELSETTELINQANRKVEQLESIIRTVKNDVTKT